jgi:hypothetical protein
MRCKTALRRPLASLLALGLAAALSASPAHAVWGRANLAWDRCWVDGGPVSKMFSCDDNEAAEHMAIVSFVMEENLPQFEALSGSVYLMTADADLPDWWQAWNPGTCRAGSLSVDVDFSSFPHAACQNTWPVATWGGVETFTPAYHGARLTFGFTPAAPRTLAAGTHYFAARLLITNDHTTGPGACPGCGAPLCIYVERLDLTSAGDVSHAEGLGDNGIGWNCGALGEYGCYVDNLCVTGARNRTWGMLKAFYR